jgi:hypothetical protein
MTADTVTDMNDFRVRRGAIVMLDALGFRGIWRRYPSHAVIAKLKDLAETTENETRSIQETAVRDQANFIEFVQPMFLSDTVVFGVTTKPAEIVNAASSLAPSMMQVLRIKLTDVSLAAEAIRIAAELTAGFIRRAVSTEPALAFRGCLSFGDFGMTDRFLIGEAIDEAASSMNKPHAAVVMLGPSADKFPQAQLPSHMSPLFRYPLPIKPDKSVQTTKCVAPFNGDDELSVLGPLLEQFGATFKAADPELRDDVAEKGANTKNFLTAAWRARHDPLDELHRELIGP